MKVNRKELVEGCILAADVFSKSLTPMMLKKTVLMGQHIDVLNAFMIDVVDVEPILANGASFRPKTDSVEPGRPVEPQPQEIPSLTASYLSAVQLYKKAFQTWQNGETVNISTVRKIIGPLIPIFLEQPREIFSLHHYAQVNDYLFHHAISVGLLSVFLGKQMKLEERQLFEIGLAGTLADCGMAKIPPKVLNKGSDLTHEEVSQLRRHPVFGYQMLKELPSIKEGLLLGVLQHHEREDGSGYPLGIGREKLHPYTKIIAVADVFHALICERPYRQKQSVFKGLELLKRDQFGKYDPRVLTLLTDEMVNMAIGTKVRLTNREVGEIVFIESKNPTRPILRMEGGGTLSLMEHRQLFIEEVVQLQPS